MTKEFDVSKYRRESRIEAPVDCLIEIDASLIRHGARMRIADFKYDLCDGHADPLKAGLIYKTGNPGDKTDAMAVKSFWAFTFLTFSEQLSELERPGCEKLIEEVGPEKFFAPALNELSKIFWQISTRHSTERIRVLALWGYDGRWKEETWVGWPEFLGVVDPQDFVSLPLYRVQKPEGFADAPRR